MTSLRQSPPTDAVIVMRRVARNIGWSAGGQVASLIVGLVALPLLLRSLGAARLGVFTLALGLLGFGSLFDLGLGRALTQAVASGLGEGRPREQMAALVWALLGVHGGLGVAWAIALWASAPYLASGLFHLRGAIARETTFGLRSLALSLPFALGASGAVGALEGVQRFRALSIGRAAMSLLQFGVPVAVASARPNVGWVIAGLASVRVLAFAAWATQLQGVLPCRPRAVADLRGFAHVLRFGGWLSVSNLVGPLVTYADRFYLATILPPAGIAYYTVPFDSLQRVAALPQTAVSAIFPAIAHSRARPAIVAPMLDLAVRGVLALGLPAALLGAVVARPLLALWLGGDFALHATTVSRWIIVGLLFNALAHIPYALLQAHGRADLTAKLHLIELPFFVLVLVVAVRAFGATGAALAWASRVGLDAVLLYASAWKLLVPLRPFLRGAMMRIGVGCAVLPPAVFMFTRWVQCSVIVLLLPWSAVWLSRLVRAYLATTPREGAR